MKKSIVLLLMLLVCSMATFADDYDALWKQVRKAAEDDLPKTEIGILEKISAKASKEKAYGQLLSAEMLIVGLQTQISPDSLQPAADRLQLKAEQAEKTDGVLAAVYYASLGKLYDSSLFFGKDRSKSSHQFYEKALANPAALAAHQDIEYEPLVKVEKGSKLFEHDLLHVIGMEADEYEVLHDFYEKKGNRAAACITALWLVKEYQFGEKRGRALDSLLTVYGDLPEACEVALLKYDYMKSQKDVTPQDLKAFAQESQKRWSSWPRATLFQNRINELTASVFNVELGNSRELPNRERTVKFTKLRNIPDWEMHVSRLNLPGDHELTTYREKDIKKLRSLVTEKDVIVERRTYTGKEDCEIFEDSITLKGLPLGTYLIEFKDKKGKIDTPLRLLYVSDLQLLLQEQDMNELRLVVLNATTGQPVPGAKVKMWDSPRYGETRKTETVTVNEQGECVKYFKNGIPNYFYVYTDNDKSCPDEWQSTNYSYYEERELVNRISVYTDRRLYRPGQTVHASVITHQVKRGTITTALPQDDVLLYLRDANNKTIAEKRVTTDEFGTASADFTLPTSGLTGSFTVMARGSVNGSTTIQVEEYKRPTFEIIMPDYQEKYAAGDTVVVTAHAKTYAGVPVQGATVQYTIKRHQALWWRWYGGADDTELLKEVVTTDEQGAFKMKMPMVLPKEDEKQKQESRRYWWCPPRFYQITASAIVTDMAGESHEGSMSLPIGTKETALSSNLPEKALADSVQSITFDYRNAAGRTIDGMVKYSFDDGKQLTTAANTPVKITLKSGRHTLKAICGKDTLEQQVVVFSMKDKTPVIHTHDWFYVSDKQFPRDGSPVYVQVGASYEPQHIVYSILSGEEVIESGVIDQNNAINTRKFTYKEEYGSGITVNYAWVREGKVYTHSASIEKPLPDKRLMAEWKTFRNRLTPGQKEEWTLLLKKPDGKPAKAQLMATLFDKSLDQIRKHGWSLYLGLNQNLPTAPWSAMSAGSINASYSENPQTKYVEDLKFSCLNKIYFDTYGEFYVSKYGARLKSGRKMMGAARADAMAGAPMMMVEDVAEEKVVVGYGKAEANSEDAATQKDEGKDQTSAAPQLRENLNETAFFYPTLQTDENGIVSIKFTLPESLTTWRFMGIAHDQDMNNTYIENEAIAQKTVMVQPNVPRFIRQGDQATLSARLFNTSEKVVKGTAKLELLQPETEEVVYSKTQTYSIAANGTSNVLFTIDAQPEKFASPLYICRVTAVGDGYSDGEQHYLPVLSGEEWVTNTVPFTQHEPGTKTVDLTTIFPQNIRSPKLTVEYTNNPAWLMIQALPYVSNPNDKNAISLVSAYYANSIAESIMNASPKIKRVIELWGKETGNETSLMSNLQKDQELKELILNETPWVLDAENEAEQKQALIRFFDENNIRQTLSSTMEKLKGLQNGDGSWSWWEGMPGSVYMTMSVTETLVRLNKMIGEQQGTKNMLNKAYKFLAEFIREEVKELKKLEKKGFKDLRPSELAVNYLYSIALSGRELSGSDKSNHDYLVNLLAKKTRELTIYGKAVSAVILGKNGYTAKANTYLQSIKEYSVYTEEMGRYFDTRKAYYSWFDYKIPTEVAAIEAYKVLLPEDKQTVEDMQRWLLQSKRTQAWDTPINSVNAIYAFLGNQEQTMTALQDQGENTVLKVNGTPLELPQATAGVGYVKVAKTDGDMKTFEAEKTSNGTSWGAVYAQFFQPVTEVADAASGIKVTREIIPITQHQSPNTHHPSPITLKVGDKIKVRITIKADRDYDFVQVLDKRAACLEPVKQLSGYHWGYYCAPKDYTTAYYFDRMSKGTHVVETEYYIDREGEYQTGTCTAQCAYAPEYTGRAQGLKLKVTK